MLNRTGVAPSLEARLLRWLGIVILAGSAWTSGTSISGAATITAADPGRPCRVELSGPIEQGDLESFMAIAATAFPEFNGESTSPNTVCLDSPGGSFVEGVALASHFYESGVGTIVERGQHCFSACAIMFIMGRAIGAEVSFINRQLHIGGQLGFHRPSLQLSEEGTFGSRDLEASYDLAVSSVVEFMVLANKTAPWSSRPMVRSDLIERMFATRGDELYFIDTVEKAARWDIELLGVEFPEQIDEVRAYYACENILQWQVGLHEDPPNLTSLTLGGYATTPHSRLVSNDDAGQLFSVVSRKAGYGAAGCLVQYQQGRLRVCAIDDYTGTEIGSGGCDPDEKYEMSYVTPLAIWSPVTSLQRINESWTGESVSARCLVLSGARIVDDETCTATLATEYATDGSASVVETFLWPSGSKTVVRTGSGSDARLNGTRAEWKYVKGYSGCYLNQGTGNQFCYVLPDP